MPTVYEILKKFKLNKWHISVQNKDVTEDVPVDFYDITVGECDKRDEILDALEYSVGFVDFTEMVIHCNKK